ncbi:metalloregulator ArsR/SmtB family transcription factor [Xanthomonas euvesicatoria]|uniref:Helix-turn-helix transcriptional regulator n=2 Tax=Stenotrophomonas TaxID=40323 RepID=A0AAW4GBP2_9GAMM|nr:MULTISPECIES: metalloregulator ArsR/SmtB family transcription factor [Xanthomonadaceae]ALA82579.1 ArsR family transcriptional regulator [Stenotrophomonas maltophilia]APO88809.1 transcriptional regulator [Xanthomonas euvesicatoria]MBA0432500.1 transcriptional regulator [Stenotrophomonas maltophilia]MBH1475961.1 helix-turn-helix transcriptional regulator [Stenotrophomonas maltophilia]MBH1501597.1 helix-turn-helix transcriptional regulator [Stenotrophomonas maltophilia]
MSKGTPKANAIEQAVSVLADPIFRALAEPSRLAVLKRVLQVERADIAEIAAGLPQERSVVSRHLQGLHDAGILRAERVSRQVYYQVDGPAMVARLEQILLQVRALAPYCCPGDLK